MKKILSFLLLLSMTLGLCACGTTASKPAEASDTAETTAVEKTAVPGSNVVILFTNDMHCCVNDNITVTGLANIKNALEASGKQVLLVDCGDAFQGDNIGTLSRGEYIVDIMNELGYAVSTPGNHDFDYTMDQFFALTERAKFPYVSANFVDADGKTVLDPYVMIEADGARFAFVGVSTPFTLTTSTPTYFQNEDGEFIYGFGQDGTGESVYAAVQSAVDSARSDGADYVLLLSHLGTNAATAPYMSSDVITHTTGIDAVLDGHSHSVIECEAVKNADGKSVLLSSTGTKLENVGCLTVDKNGGIEVKLINSGSVGPLVDDINAKFDELLNEVIAHTDVELYTHDPKTGERMIRSNETNLGDFCTDAYRYATGADIAILNGGCMRTNIPAGDITYGQIISVHPFGNQACAVEATGQELLDALELSASKLPDEFGGFLQVSGMSYTIDLSVESSVVTDENQMFVSVDGERRVKDVMVGGEPIDPARIYTVACHNYELQEKGDGYNMFADNNFVLDCFMIDNQVLLNYCAEVFSNGSGEDYADPYGQGRITIIGG